MSVVVVSVAGVKLVVKVRVLPTANEAAALAATLRTCNESASWVSGRMHELRLRGKYEAQKRFYTDLKARFGLSAQPTIRVIGKVVDGFLAVDFGIVNIAASSDGQRLAGARLNRYRKRQQRLRARLQAKKTSSARRLLTKRRRKEARFAADVNHQISKRIGRGTTHRARYRRRTVDGDPLPGTAS
jgi:hypothetical protein